MSTSADGDSLDRASTASPKVIHSHPISSIPSELLAEIFFYCSLPELKNRPGLHHAYLGGGPVAASQVCRYWRQIAYAHPVLWSHIYVCATIADKLRLVQAVEARIALAGEHPLFIEYREEGGKSGGACPTLDLLIAHSQRWESVSLNLTHTPLVHLGVLRGAVPRLRTASITSTRISAFLSSKLELQRAFVDAPMLSSFTYVVGNSKSAELPFLLPWGQLTRYCGPLFTEANPPRYARSLLKRAETLVVSDVTSFTTWERTELPALRTLSAHVQTFAGLVAPALVDLRVRGSLIGTDVGRLLSFLSRSDCKLRKLCMHAVVLGAQAELLVAACSTVEELVCAAGRESNAWVGRLPHLRILTLVVVSRPATRAGPERTGLPYLVESGALMDIVHARAEKQPKLSRIDIWLSSDCEESMHTEASSQLVRAGDECGVDIEFRIYEEDRTQLMEYRWTGMDSI